MKSRGNIEPASQACGKDGAGNMHKVLSSVMAHTRCSINVKYYNLGLAGNTYADIVPITRAEPTARPRLRPREAKRINF